MLNFYKHLQQIKGRSHSEFRLKCGQGEATEDPMQCAEMLNTYFHSQFGQNQLTGYEERLVVAANNIEITSQGIEKLIQNLKKW